MQFRAPDAGESPAELPMLFHPSIGLHRPITFEGSVVHFRISTVRTDTLATASAGALLEREHGGAWLTEPRDMMIKYDVVRPVRSLALARPLVVAGQPLLTLLVRTSERRPNEILQSGDEADFQEIVVTAARTRPPAYMVSLGMDWMRSCSSMTWNNRTNRMTLRCLNPPAS